VSANTGHVGMGAPWVAAGGVLSYAAARDFRKASRLLGLREDSPSPADPASLVKRHVPLSPRAPPPLPLSTLAPPPPQTIPPHPGPGYKAVKLEEIRRLCAQGRSDGLTDAQMKHMHKFYCKLGAGFCLVSTGGAVSGLSGSLAAWAPWMAAGVWMSCSAAKSLQTAASLPGVDGRVDGAELVRRGGSLGGGGEGLGH